MEGRRSEVCQPFQRGQRVNLLEQIGHSVFIDTAPIIYYIEAHPQYGPIVRDVVRSFQTRHITAFSSVITLTEVLPKPVEAGDEKLAERFLEFLKFGKNISVVEISESIAERAGRLRGKYPRLKTIDAIQVAAAIDVETDTFLTNDKSLRRIEEAKVLILEDYA
jgi:predicted nucleic acid-binding protein